jgi:phospholipase A1
MHGQATIFYCALAFTSFVFPSYAQETVAQETVEKCVMKAYFTGDGSLTLGEIRNACSGMKIYEDEVEIAKLSITSDSTSTVGAISSRIIKERQTEFEPYVITPHKINYILPAITTDGINKEVYSGFEGYKENLEDIETKFQLSFKVPLNYESKFLAPLGHSIYPPAPERP